MPNKFKYNKTGTEPNSLFKGKWAIDTTPANSGGGPSSITGFYAGSNIPLGGYAIYGSAGVFIANNDEELLGGINKLGANAISASEALTWIAGQPDYVVLNKSFDNIVTEGLVLNLDSRHVSSFVDSEPTINLLPSPENFNTWGTTNMIVRPNTVLAPDGTDTAYSMYSTSGTYPSISIGMFPATNPHRGSLWIRSNTGANQIINFNLFRGSPWGLGEQTDITVTPEWTRYDVSMTALDSTYHVAWIGRHIGSGASVDISIWKGQIESKSYATPYVNGTRTQNTIWQDLSGQGNNGNLYNGPTFNNGAIVFDAVDDRVHTIQGALGNNASYSVLLKSYGGANAYNMYMGQYLPYMGVYAGDRIVYSDYINGAQSWFATDAGTIISNKWYNIVCTRVYNGSSTDMKIYINGVVISAINTPGQKTPFALPDTIAIGDGANFSWYPYYGEIVSAQVYNKALTSQEIYQNYYSGPIVTNGLIHTLDAGNLVSYENGSTNAYSLVGSNVSSLINGVGWSKKHSGAWNFDGTDDYINCGNASELNITRAVTMELWFKVTLFGSPWTNIFGKMNNDGDSNTRCYSAFINSSGFVHLTTFDGAGQEQLDSTSFITPGGWYHWTGVIDRDAGVIKQYVNGALNASAGIRTNNIITNTETLKIGYTGNYYQKFNGEVSISRLYNRALTQEEVLQNFNAQRNRFGI